MTLHPDDPELSTPVREKKTGEEKKMMGGSFAVSLVIHAVLLLIIGGIVIVPAAMEKIMPVTSVAPPPMDIPEPPPLDESAESDTAEPEGTPIRDAQESVTVQQEQQAEEVDALVVDSPSTVAPRLNASSSTGSLSSDVFAQRTGPSGSGGTSARGSGKGGVSRTTFFGSTDNRLESSLVGRIYDLKQDRARGALPPPLGKMVATCLTPFAESGFSPSALRKYFTAPDVLYAGYFLVPWMDANEAPKAFGVEKEIQPNFFLLHYTGLVASPVDMTARFVGWGDNFNIVAINKKVVMDGSRPNDRFISDWKPSATPLTVMGGDRFTSGDWITWKANEFKRIDLIFGETSGGVTHFGLYLEVQGMEYKKTDKGVPILPLFRVSAEKVKLPEKAVYVPFETKGPIFKAKHLQ